MKNFNTILFGLLLLLCAGVQSQTIQASNGLTNNGNVAIGIWLTGIWFETTININTYATCSWEHPFGTNTFKASDNNCYPVSNANFDLTCTISSSIATSRLTLYSALSSNINVSLICVGVSSANDITNKFSLLAKYCGNPSQAGVSAAPANSGFGATHTFNCTTGYTGTPSPAPATCQADATWNLASTCSAVCNTTTIPSSPSYVSPSTSELIVVESSKDLTCTSGYTGSASAVCNAAGDTRSWTVTNGCKAVCSQLSADYCVHGTNTSVTTVTEGSDVTVGCCNGKSGSTTAVCATPGNITLSLDCSQVTTVTTTTTAATTVTTTTIVAANTTRAFAATTTSKGESPKPNPHESDSLRRPTET